MNDTQPNPALGAEKAVGWLSQEALDEYSKVEAEHRELQQQLDAERERHQAIVDGMDSVIGEANTEIQQLREQLAKAQAAIAEHNEKVYDRNICCAVIIPDIHALDAHVAASQQPLVDALKEVSQGANSNRGRCMDCDSIATIAYAALAKVKVKK